jgi:Fic family protein
MAELGLAQRDHAALQALTQEVITTSAIEGEALNLDAVRSSIARRLGVDIGALAPADRDVDGVVDMVLDATQVTPTCDALIHAGLAHLWLVTLHPFDDGNGRISRAVGDMALARAVGTAQRFYSLSAQIQRERKQYYDELEAIQRGALNVTPWLSWFLGCLLRAVQGAQRVLLCLSRGAAPRQLGKLCRHRGVAPRELLDRQIVGLVVGESQIVG